MSEESSSRCPKCGKQLVVVGDDGRFLECSGFCGYRFDAFLSKEAITNIVEGSLFDERETGSKIKDLAWTTASELLNKHHFVTVHDGHTSEILRYSDGVYLPDGAGFIKREIQEFFEDKTAVNTHLVNEVIGHIERSTIRPRSIFDETSPHLVLSNGLLNLQTMEFSSHTPDYYALNKMKVAYDPSKDCPNFKRFVGEILPPEDVQGVQEELGAILSKRYLTKKLSIYQGDTDTGKTTLINVILAFLGPENVSSVSIQEIASRNPFVLSELYGKLANIRDDITKDIIYSVGKLKELTGHFQVMAQKKFRDPFHFTNHAYLVFTCNQLPPLLEDDEAFFNRVMLRKFTRRFGGKDRPDRELAGKLATPEEQSGILNWSLEGLRRLAANGWNFTNTVTVDVTRETYRRQSDPVWAFVNDCLEEESDSAITKENLWQAFKAYCEAKSIPLIYRDQFLKILPSKVNVNSGYRLVKGETEKKHCFIGIKFALGKDEAAPGAPAALGQETLEHLERPEQPSRDLKEGKPGPNLQGLTERPCLEKSHEE